MWEELILGLGLSQVVPGRDGRTLEALCWVGPRLFSSGLDGDVTEYDLENLRPLYSLEAYGGPVWTLSCDSQETLLAVRRPTKTRSRF